jgi:hypothetical protein
MQSQSLIQDNNDWLEVILANAGTEEDLSANLSQLITYINNTFRFETPSGQFNVAAIKRVAENLFRGATQLIAWSLMSLDTSDSPFIIHDKIALFQVVKIIYDLVVGIGMPSGNVVFVKDPNMERPPSSTFPKQLFDIRRKFLNDDVRIIGNPDANTRVIIPLNFHLNGYLGNKYPIVIANYLRMFEVELENDPEDAATLENISLFFGMYDGCDSYADLLSDELAEVLTNEMEIVSWASGQLLKVEYASKFAVTEHYRQAKALINNIFKTKLDLIKDYLAADIALYLTLEGTQTMLRPKFSLAPDIAEQPMIDYFVNPFTMNPMLAMICVDVRTKIETLRNDKEKFANHYAQYVIFIFLNYGLMNPCGIFEIYIRKNRDTLYKRLDLNRNQKKNVSDNLGIFLHKYSNQKYFFKGKNLLEEKPDAVPEVISNKELRITEQPIAKINFMPEPRLVQMHYNLFRTRRAPNFQAKELVNAVVQLAEEYVSTPALNV